jgi:uncharacterized protein YbjT (DUF2867 family)
VWISSEIETIEVRALSRARTNTLEYVARRALATGCRELILVVDRDPEETLEAFAGIDALLRDSGAQLTVVRRPTQTRVHQRAARAPGRSAGAQWSRRAA